MNQQVEHRTIEHLIQLLTLAPSRQPDAAQLSQEIIAEIGVDEWPAIVGALVGLLLGMSAVLAEINPAFALDSIVRKLAIDFANNPDFLDAFGGEVA